MTFIRIAKDFLRGIFTTDDDKAVTLANVKYVITVIFTYRSHLQFCGVWVSGPGLSGYTCIEKLVSLRASLISSYRISEQMCKS